MPHWSKLEYLGSQTIVKKTRTFATIFIHTPDQITHSSSKSILYKFELSFGILYIKGILNLQLTDPIGALFHSK